MAIVDNFRTSLPLCVYSLLATGNYTEDEVRSCFGDCISEYEEDSRETGWSELAYNIFVTDALEQWQNKFGIVNCNVTEIVYDRDSDSLDKMEYPLNNVVDGYADCHRHFGSDYDSQIMTDGNFIVVMVAGSREGGLLALINKNYTDARLYKIGEDDGHWFIADSSWVLDEKIWKNRLCSVVSEIHLDRFDHQKIIDILWNK